MIVASPLDAPVLSERYFFPRKVPLAEPFLVRCPDGATLALYRRTEKEDAPTVVFFHGNGEVVADYLPWFPSWISEMGCNVALFEY